MTARNHAPLWVLALIALLAGLALGAAPARADDLEYDEVRKLRQSGDIRPLAELLEKAQAQHEGELLEAELDERDGQLVYEIELLTKDGEVWEFFFDARTGELIESEQED
jgi:uncharacterized membrane protein YkoI